MAKGNIDPALQYIIDKARRYPLLSVERERDIATAWQARRDRAALDELVGSHLRLVIKIARGFSGYGLPLADLVGEGNLGLLHAADRFEPEHGCRFATYAMWWIRSTIQGYVLQNWSLVKIGTTPARKKLFFSLRRLKTQLGDVETNEIAEETARDIARLLDVSENLVIDMDRRLAARDASLNAADETGQQWLDLLRDRRPGPDVEIERREEARRRRELLEAALERLDEREYEIVVARRLQEEPSTLSVLGQRYDLSRERIRQIEEAAISKMARFLSNASRQERAGQMSGVRDLASNAPRITTPTIGPERRSRRDDQPIAYTIPLSTGDVAAPVQHTL